MKEFNIEFKFGRYGVIYLFPFSWNIIPVTDDVLSKLYINFLCLRLEIRKNGKSSSENK